MLDTRLVPWDLAKRALQDGWNLQAVQISLLGRIKRDQEYLASRKAKELYSPFDEATERDLFALALAWHEAGGTSTQFPLDILAFPWNWFYYAAHALAYTAVLFLAGIFGKRPKSSKEIVLAIERALEQ
jgi:hypothetical protein